LLHPIFAKLIDLRLRCAYSSFVRLDNTHGVEDVSCVCSQPVERVTSQFSRQHARHTSDGQLA